MAFLKLWWYCSSLNLDANFYNSAETTKKATVAQIYIFIYVFVGFFLKYTNHNPDIKEKSVLSV